MEHQRPAGLLRPLGIPEWNCGFVSMDIMVGLSLTQRKNNLIWIIVERLAKITHFIAIKNTWTLD